MILTAVVTFRKGGGANTHVGSPAENTEKIWKLREKKKENYQETKENAQWVKEILQKKRRKFLKIKYKKPIKIFKKILKNKKTFRILNKLKKIFNKNY